MIVNTNCRFYKGDVPCKPHKDEGVHCENCNYYTPVKEKILVIKLGAMGDVIRTTPIVQKIRRDCPHAEISWLTCYPEVVPSEVDKVYNFDLKSILSLLSIPFDVVYSLDKDAEACSLVNLMKADTKKGFFLKDGKCNPLDSNAYHKWLTGLFDDISRQNTKSYPEEIFEICGIAYNKEEYIFDAIDTQFLKNIKSKNLLIGLNTGSGGRWRTRIWPDEYWEELAKKLRRDNYDVLLLGGEEEDEKNKRIADRSGSLYFGHFPIKQFASLVQQCDLIVTVVTMALHIAIATKRKIVLLNNVFNRNEFELYGLGKIIEPNVDCLGCYKSSCEEECMRRISPDTVLEVCKRMLSKNTHG